MLFLVDDGNGGGSYDHAVVAIGYEVDSNGVDWYGCYNTWDNTGGSSGTIHWYQFQNYITTSGTNTRVDVPFGVYGGIAFDPQPEFVFSTTGLTTLNVPLALTTSTSMDVTTSCGSLAGISGSISGSGSLVLMGGGELILSGSNNYTGGTDVVSGELVLSHADSLPRGSSLTIGSAAAFGAGSDGEDVSIGSSPYESGAPPSTETVPEPSTIAVVCAVGPLLLMRFLRRRKR